MRLKGVKRQIVEVDEQSYVVVAKGHGASTLTLRRLRGDFSDLRQVLGITQVKMARQLGISQSYLSKLESGEAPMPTRGTVYDLVGEIVRMFLRKE